MVLQGRAPECEKQQPKSEALSGNLADLQLRRWRTVRSGWAGSNLEELFLFVCVCACMCALVWPDKKTDGERKLNRPD